MKTENRPAELRRGDLSMYDEKIDKEVNLWYNIRVGNLLMVTRKEVT